MLIVMERLKRYTKGHVTSRYIDVATKLDASASNGAIASPGTRLTRNLRLPATALEILTSLLMEQHTRLRLA